MRSRSIIVGLLVSCSLVGAGCTNRARGSDAFYAEAARTDPRRHPYVIGVAADVVRITVEDQSVDGRRRRPAAPDDAARRGVRPRACFRRQAGSRGWKATSKTRSSPSLSWGEQLPVHRPGQRQHRMFTSRYYVTFRRRSLAGGPNRYASRQNRARRRRGRTPAGRSTDAISPAIARTKTWSFSPGIRSRCHRVSDRATKTRSEGFEGRS
jgi:hypothetical protein